MFFQLIQTRPVSSILTELCLARGMTAESQMRDKHHVKEGRLMLWVQK